MTELDFTQPISISIICLAGFVYYRLIFAKLTLKQSSLADLYFWQHTLQLCICALPLIGLLGTIVGLLDSFLAMALGETISGQNRLTTGISNALFTTQLGLLFAIPAWLLFAYVNRHISKQQLIQNGLPQNLTVQNLIAQTSPIIEKGTLSAS